MRFPSHAHAGVTERSGRDVERDRYELGELIAIGGSLNSERDIGRLLGLILEKSRLVTGADAGSVFVAAPSPDDPDQRVLRFEVAQNDSVEIDFGASVVEITAGSIVGAAALGKDVIHIPNLDELKADNPWGLSHDRSFDARTGYRTRSVLAVPMVNARDETIGVIQLINKKRRPGMKLTSERAFDEEVIPFDTHAIDLAKTLAYQAAIALDNAQLYDELRCVFEGLVEAAVVAIEQRDPTTSGHSRRVADLTVGLAKTVDGLSSGPYADQRFSPEELKEIEFAGLLHDFGKVGVPEHVLVKANKLYPWDLERVMARFDYIRLWLERRSLALDLEIAAQRLRGESEAKLQQEIARLSEERAFVDQCVESVKVANRPTVLDGEVIGALEQIAARTYVDGRGKQRPYLTAEELACLGIRRGSLNEQERRQIESHVQHSYNFLCAIPWGRDLRRVPEIAGAHHEKLDGTGYPRRRPAAEIPVQAKMMTIADIYDALTASDRPYKQAVPLEAALRILESEVAANKLDAELFEVFVGAKVFRLANPQLRREH